MIMESHIYGCFIYALRQLLTDSARYVYHVTKVHTVNVSVPLLLGQGLNTHV
jgi:hypothetical protein